jgi:signal transduction histidine kinase
MAKKISDISLIAHELQAPLTLLRSRLEAALDAYWCKDESLELVETSLREVENMSRVIVDLLLLERVESDGLPREGRRLDLAELARTVCESFRPSADARGIDLGTAFDGSHPIHGNPNELHRILVNIVDNALKYTPAGGKVSLEGRLSENEVGLSVKDTGCGIPRESIPHLFERFYQVDKARDREAGGTGLGLSIVDALVEQNGGTVEVESTPGKGTRVIVRFPYRPG